MPRFSHGRRDLRAQVAHELRSLGGTQDEVAQRLEAAGVRGRPGNIGTCALAVYLSAVIGGDARVHTVLVGHEHVFITLEGWEGCVGVPLPKVLGGFVFDFDRWRYPTLVRPPGEVVRKPEHAAA